jgi:high-affinity iron transporter
VISVDFAETLGKTNVTSRSQQEFRLAFSFVVTLREGVEMALIVAILLGYLRSSGRQRYFRHVWAGVGVAAAVSIVIGVALELASKELDGRIVEGFEGFTMIFAVAILTGMAFWMRGHARGISSQLRAQVDQALSGGSMAAIVFLAASSVGREGLETVLFLFAGSTTGASGIQYIAGGVLGFAVAAIIGAGIYHGSSRLPLKQFFTLSGLAVIVLAAGLLATSVVKLYEAAVITNLGSRPWDTERFISITSGVGKFLNTLFGYDSAPSMLQIVLYWGYLLTVGTAFVFLPSRKPRAKAPPGQVAAPTSASAP